MNYKSANISLYHMFAFMYAHRYMNFQSVHEENVYVNEKRNKICYLNLN